MFTITGVVLVVDNDGLNIYVLRYVLNFTSCNVKICENGLLRIAAEMKYSTKSPVKFLRQYGRKNL